MDVGGFGLGCGGIMLMLAENVQTIDLDRNIRIIYQFYQAHTGHYI